MLEVTTVFAETLPTMEGPDHHVIQLRTLRALLLRLIVGLLTAIRLTSTARYQAMFEENESLRVPRGIPRDRHSFVARVVL